MRRAVAITGAVIVLCVGAAIFYLASKSTVSLSAEPSVVPRGETVTISLTNDSETAVGWGYPYELQQRVGDSWRRVPLDIGFPLPLLAVGPGETQVVNEIDQQLDPGTYRVIKWVSIPPGNRKEIRVSTTFSVT